MDKGLIFLLTMAIIGYLIAFAIFAPKFRGYLEVNRQRKASRKFAEKMLKSQPSAFVRDCMLQELGDLDER